MSPKAAKASKQTAHTEEPSPSPDSEPRAASPFSVFAEGPLLDAVHELEALLSQCRLAFLIGAGCSCCAGLPLMVELTAQVLDDLPATSADILSAIVGNFNGAERCTIEDYMSELVDTIAIAERRRQRATSTPTVAVGSHSYSSDILLATLDDIKLAIAKKIASPNRNIETHRNFVRLIHNTLRSGKGSAPKTPVEYFTLNYDTLIEDALSLERIPFVDGFHGGATGWWSIDRYDDSAAHARVYKLHGSIDWCLCDGDTLPRRIRDGVAVPSRQDNVLIWPAATKYRETQRDPYAQLVSLMRRSLRPTSNTEVVLCICGYAFADEHVNVEIDRALRESNNRLTIVAFTSDNEPTGQLSQWLQDPEVAARVRVYANRGFFHGQKSQPSDVDLPWWRFETLTALLTGQR